MDISNNTISIRLQNVYETEIFGLGEVYEIMSVERIRKKLRGKFSGGILFLASNKGHSERGMTLKELGECLGFEKYVILKKGYVDSPPWKSSLLKEEDRKKYSFFSILAAKAIFFILLRLEFMWQGENSSHMIYVLVKNK